MEEAPSFFTCYRILIKSYRLPPETAEAQLAEILRRVRDVNTAAPAPAALRPRATLVQEGGPNP